MRSLPIKLITLRVFLSTLALSMAHNSMANLPEHVWFKGNQQNFNSTYYSAVKDGMLWVKPNTDTTGTQGSWQQLTLPSGLEGDVQEIASDDEHIIAINSQREIFTMWNALDGIDSFRWQKAWGIPFWRGPGLTLNKALLKWDFSVVSPRFDEYYVDPAGNHTPIGVAKVSHIIGLKPDGRNVAYNDPWLPRDWSYEICGPERGLFPIHTLSASGSTTFVMGKLGDMYTRIYDFDLSGHDDLFKYSYEDQRGRKQIANLPQPLYVILYSTQLPAFPWVKQPKIQGRITDRISIHKIGKGVINRVLRVEGWNEMGRTGFYEKELIQTQSSDWKFYATDEAIAGNEINNTDYDSSRETLLASEGISFSASANSTHSWEAKIADFDPYCSPSVLTITDEHGYSLPITLHALETIRLTRRERALNHKKLRLAGMLELDEAIWKTRETLSPSLQQFVTFHFSDKRFRAVKVYAKSNELLIKGKKKSDSIYWEFVAD